ncbi:MAG: tetratricopeptide repeat protein [Chloroflexota bacterium]|nr:tetratricopeptide repeat protein [Chloroflexota bacterium]
MTKPERGEHTFQELPWRLWVKKRRKTLGLTQAELARRVAYSVEMIGHLERGLDRPSPELAGRLADILEVPSAERDEFVRIARLEARALTQEPAPPRKPLRTRIPGLPATPLIGRAEVVDQVRLMLGSRDHRLVTITGPAGVGKTRLAIAVAEEVEDYYRDGVFWVALESFREATLALNAIAQVLGIKETDQQPLLDVVQATIWDKHILLVLDNCEQVAGLSSLVAKLLAVPGLHLLGTSRRRLRLRGERQVVLAPLALPSVTTLLPVEELRNYPAVALFVARAEETYPGFVLDDSNAAAVAQICVALDGLPLALELAAVRIGVLPPAAMLARLHECIKWVGGGLEDLPKHHQTLSGALDWSYNLLTPAQQLLFRRLSVFAGGFTLGAAGEVCISQDGSAVDVLTTITELVDWNLVYRAGSPEAVPRYYMLVTTQEYAVKCLQENGEEAQLRRRHLLFYLDLAEQALAARASGDAEGWLEQLEAEQANFRATLDWGLSNDGDMEPVKRLAVALCWFWELRGCWQEARLWLARLLVQKSDCANYVEAQLRFYAGRFAYLQSDYITAERLLKESLECSREQDELSTQAWTLNTLGWLAYSRSDYPHAEEFYRRSLYICQAMGDPLAIATTLQAMGATATALGQLETAETLLQESLALRREQGDRQGIARTLNALGLAALHRDDPTRARHLFGESLQLFRAVGDKLGTALACNNLGWSYFAEGARNQTQIVLSEALSLAKEVGSVWCKTLTLCYLGWVALEQGEQEESLRSLEESLSLAEAQGVTQLVILCHIGLGRAALARGDRAQAVQHWDVAEGLRHQLGIILPPFERRAASELSLLGRSS